MPVGPDQEILIADDDASIRDMLVRAFQKDFRVYAARDGTEAIRYLQSAHPVAVLVDEMMPGATGTEVLEHAKSLWPDVPRMLMTANQDSQRAMEAVNRGEIHRFYSKPLKVVDVKRALIELVARAQADSELKAELRALRRINESSQVINLVRMVILGDGDAADAVANAATQRSFFVVRITRFEDMPATLMATPADVVVLVADHRHRNNIRALAQLAHSIDEATAVVIVDAAPRIEEALLALEVGAVDYIASPMPDAATLAARLERSAQRPRQQRDMRRLTFELIIANRDLAQSRKRVEREQVALVNAMIRALEARDSYTAGHTDRVAAISVRCGQALSLEPAQLEVLRMGALLHDIGKIGIRDEVLLKPGRLSPEEFEAIKQHTTIGASLLGDIEQFQCILPIVRGHHEKLDGSGYPDKLSGDQVILEVRIVSASDVIDAVTSTRPYRRGSTIEEAFELVEGAVGKHLDRVVVDALKQVHREGRLLELLQPGATEAEGPAPYRAN
jgi:putative nucleotidyltransferase with HDIG domain